MSKKLNAPQVEAQVSGDLGQLLKPVYPSEAFREHLLGNLVLAARRKVTGDPVVETPAAVTRKVYLIAGILGIIATFLGLVIYLWEDRNRVSSPPISP